MSRGENRELRMQRIVALVKERKKISTKELADTLQVTEMTIRRDLTALEKDKAIQRVHGFAEVAPSESLEPLTNGQYDFSIASVQNAKEKDKIAQYAASLIQPNDWVFIDNGTTTARIPAFLPRNIEFTALCCNFALMVELTKYPNIHLIMPGGYYSRIDQTFTSAQSHDFIRMFRAKKAFISASGIHKTLGVTCINANSVGNKQAFIASADKKILLADSSKFDSVASNYVTDLNAFDEIITDDGIVEDWEEYLYEKNIRLTVVPAGH